MTRGIKALPCPIDDCGRNGSVGGVCLMHYKRAVRMAANNTPRVPRSEVFWTRVTEGPGGCWIWTGCRTRGDYGTFHVSQDRPNVRAHRYAYELMVGEIPDGLHLDHLCRVRLCVNPAHLDPVPAAVNAARTAKAMCLRGHEFTADNTYTDPSGQRQCRSCRHIRESHRRPRRAAA